MIVAYKDNFPIAYNSVRQKVENELYISQIAIKKEYKRLGIGTKMMEIVIEIAKLNNMDIAARVRYYNIPSIEMFKSLGFTKSMNLTKKGSYKFVLKQKELTCNSDTLMQNVTRKKM